MQQPQIGGQAMIRLLIKSNEDVTDALLSMADGGSQLDAGARERIEAAYDGRFALKITQEPTARIECLHQQLAGVAFPDFLREQGLNSLVAQFESQIFTTETDILLLSIQSDLILSLWRHLEAGVLVSPPPDWETIWSSEQKSWFKKQFQPLKYADGESYRESLTQLVKTLKDKTSAHIIVFGACSFEAKSEPYNMNNRDDSLTIRTHRLNLAMLEVSFSEGISFIDVDRILAEIGCVAHVNGRFRYSTTAYEAIRDEFMRVITDVGFFEERPLLVQMGHQKR